MGREARKVPPDWRHPKNEQGAYIPLFSQEDLAAHRKYEDPEFEIRLDNYMPDWPAEERTHLQMYEACTEGTPISPIFKTAEELARWLADNKASAFGSMTADYESWLATIKSGEETVGMAIRGGEMISGVELEKESSR